MASAASTVCTSVIPYNPNLPHVQFRNFHEFLDLLVRIHQIYKQMRQLPSQLPIFNSGTRLESASVKLFRGERHFLTYQVTLLVRTDATQKKILSELRQRALQIYNALHPPARKAICKHPA